MLAAVLTAVTVGGVSYAVGAAGGGTDTFFACASSGGVVRSSTIHVNQAPPLCKTGDSVTSWNAQGQTGAQGPVGQASVVALPPGKACPTLPPSTTDAAAGPASFLAVPSIQGESTDQAHLGQIDLLGWSMSSNGGNTTGACGGVSGQTSLDGLSIVKLVDKATPKLFAAVANGTDLSTIVLSASKQGTDYLVVSLDNAIATSQSFSAANSSQPIPTESVTFNGSRLTISYRQQLSDGTFDPPISHCYDLKNKGDC